MNTSALIYPALDPTLVLRSALERIRLLEAEVLRLQPKPSLGEKAIRVFHAGRLIRVPLTSVLYFKAESNYTRIYLKDGQQYYVSRTLKSWINEIADPGFIRCHRSYLINQSEVEDLNRASGEIRLSSGTTVPSSRRFQRTSIRIIFPRGHQHRQHVAAKPDCTVHKLPTKGVVEGF